MNEFGRPLRSFVAGCFRRLRSGISKAGNLGGVPFANFSGPHNQRARLIEPGKWEPVPKFQCCGPLFIVADYFSLCSIGSEVWAIEEVAQVSAILEVEASLALIAFEVAEAQHYFSPIAGV
jgi:hypothetical protein